MTRRTGFAKALQFVRKRKGMTQEDFSGVSSRTYLSTLERGLKSPTLQKVEDLASALGVHPLTLLTLAYLHAEDNSADRLFQRVGAEIKSLDIQ